MIFFSLYFCAKVGLSPPFFEFTLVDQQICFSAYTILNKTSQAEKHNKFHQDLDNTVTKKNKKTFILNFYIELTN